MIIYPAIDLRNGCCVRLYQGNYARETVYGTDPVLMAKKFIADGTTWLHIVDLDGANNPSQNQSALILELIDQCPVKVQIGGGIRSFNQVKLLVDNGAARVVVGSLAIQNPVEVAQWFQYFGAERITLALDVMFNQQNQAMVAVNAWQKISDVSLYSIVEYYQPLGLTHVLCTNIRLDGTLQGPDDALYDAMLTKYPLLQLQASGGIQSVADLTALRQKGINGAIIGKALYEKKFTLNEALSC